MSLAEHASEVKACAFSPAGALMVTVSRDKTARIWNTADWSLVKVLTGHASDVMSCTFSPNGDAPSLVPALVCQAFGILVWELELLFSWMNGSNNKSTLFVVD